MGLSRMLPGDQEEDTSGPNDAWARKDVNARRKVIRQWDLWRLPRLHRVYTHWIRLRPSPALPRRVIPKVLSPTEPSR
jgi:hypothetical protein